VLKYEITVEGILRDGHPISYNTNSEKDASDVFDYYVKTYPHNQTTMFTILKEELFVSKPAKKPVPTCPRGHTGYSAVRGMPVVHEGSNGLYYCSTCGWREVGV